MPKMLNVSLENALGLPAQKKSWLPKKVRKLPKRKSDTGAAYKAGIKQGDVITKIGDQTVKSIQEVQEKVNSTKAGTTIKVTVQRSNDGTYKAKQVDVVLKGKDTLDGLDDGSTQQQNDSSQDYNNNYDNDNSQVVPWGGSIY